MYKLQDGPQSIYGMNLFSILTLEKFSVWIILLYATQLRHYLNDDLATSPARAVQLLLNKCVNALTT